MNRIAVICLMALSATSVFGQISVCAQQFGSFRVGHEDVAQVHQFTQPIANLSQSG
jgi:hypothetical protein